MQEKLLRGLLCRRAHSTTPEANMMPSSLSSITEEQVYYIALTSPCHANAWAVTHRLAAVTVCTLYTTQIVKLTNYRNYALAKYQ